MSDDIKAVNDQNFESEVTNHKGFVLVDFWQNGVTMQKSDATYRAIG